MRILFLGTNQIIKIFKIFDKENLCIIAYAIPIAIFCVKLYGEIP